MNNTIEFTSFGAMMHFLKLLEDMIMSTLKCTHISFENSDIPKSYATI